jgi:hypothetical protein
LTYQLSEAARQKKGTACFIIWRRDIRTILRASLKL